MCAKLLCLRGSKRAVGSRDGSMIPTFWSNDIGPKRKPKPSWGFFGGMTASLPYMWMPPKLGDQRGLMVGPIVRAGVIRLTARITRGWWFDHHHDKRAHQNLTIRWPRCSQPKGHSLTALLTILKFKRYGCVTCRPIAMVLTCINKAVVVFFWSFPLFCRVGIMTSFLNLEKQV